MEFINTTKNENILEIVFNRPGARNVMNMQMFQEFCRAVTMLEEDPEIRCALIYAEGKHFTMGLDLPDVVAALKEQNRLPIPENTVNPWDPAGLIDRARTKPLICAVHGFCFTLGIELLLACDVGLAARGTRFSQAEVQRGIMPFGGATIRFVQAAGWSNAMRYILTGDVFDAAEARRMGIVQEVLEVKDLQDRARAIAKTIASSAPLAVQACLRNARLALTEGEQTAARQILPEVMKLLASDDAQEGELSFIEKRSAQFKGK